MAVAGSSGCVFNESNLWDIVIKYNISLVQESSGPREPPPQSLADTDVNLSVHPAPIDQPIVALISNVRTDTTFFSRYAQANKRLCAYVGVTFCISAWPIVVMNR